MNRLYKISEIFSALLNIYFFVFIFDGIRESLYLPNVVNLFISLARDSLYIVLLLLILFYRHKIFIPSFLFFFILLGMFIPTYLSFFSTPVSARFDINRTNIVIDTFRCCYWMFRMFSLFIIFVNIKDIYVFSDLYLIKLTILITVYLFIFSLFIYICFPSYIISKFYIDRIGLGNPSIQSGIYICTIILTLEFHPFSDRKSVIVLLILSVAVILTVTSTGILCLIYVLLVYFLFTKQKKNIIRLFLCIFFLSFIFIVKYWDLIALFVEFIIVKMEELSQLIVKVITNSEEKTQSGSFGVREKQIELLKNKLSFTNLIFGFGYFNVNTNLIENGYYAILHDYGLFGLFILGFFILRCAFFAVVDFFKHKNVFKIAVIMVFVLYNVTLDVFIIYNLSSVFMYMIFLAFYKENVTLEKN